MTIVEPFETLFAVPLECEGCIGSIHSALHQLAGIRKVDVNLKEQLVSVEGTVAPSRIVAAIQGTGRDAILRGSGKPDGAAVSILEVSELGSSVLGPVRGLARMVQVSPGLTIIDLTLNDLTPGKHYATIRETGDISRGADSTGGVWWGGEPADQPPRGRLGEIEVGESGTGNLLLDKPIEIWELIGRSFVVSRQNNGRVKNGPDTLVGVIARSAGVWENTKTVCSCSGRNIWEERAENVGRGMI